MTAEVDTTVTRTPAADTVPVIERIRDAEDNGAVNVRVVLTVPGLLPGELEPFKSKWRYDTGQPDTELIGKALSEYHAHLTLRRREESAAGSEEAIAAQIHDDIKFRDAQRFAAGYFRPAGRPEVVATFADASGYTRRYRIVPALRSADGLLGFDAVYDVPDDGRFGVVHERGRADYDGAAFKLGQTLAGMAARVADLVTADPVVQHTFNETLADKEAVAAARLAAEARERAEAESARQTEWAARQAILAHKVKAKRGTATVPVWDDKTGRRSALTELPGLVVGPFLVHRRDGRDPRYDVIHVGTGLSAGTTTHTQAEAKVLASLMAAWGRWDFADAEKMGHDTSIYGSKVTWLWKRGRWADLVAYLAEKGVTL